ncbi:MAG: sodium:alanine symporter family protein, partial [Leptonema sp. (in: Bacteria)]|nr:sodium:alanine symporter family protein [Leptonema sp. (in: bacteria)]
MLPATMKTDILLSSTSYPIFLILLLAGMYLTVKLGFIQLRYPFLSLKILAGALDWRSSQGRITPGQAFFAGSLGSLIPGSFAATILALVISGPAIFPLLWLIHFFQASTEYVLSTSTHRSRERNQKGLIESSPLLAATRLTRVRWAGLLYSVFFILAALNAGSILNIFLLKTVTAPLKNVIPIPGALGLSIAFLFAVGLITAGGIRRIGSFAKFTGYASIILIIAAVFSISFNPVVHTTNFFKAMFADIILPYQRSQLPTTLLSVSVYFALAEYGSGRLSTIAGAVRTDHSAKQGLVAQLFPLLQILLSFIVAVLLYGQLSAKEITTKLDIEQIVSILSQVFSTVLVIQIDELVSPISYVFIAVLLLFLVLSTITWLYAGNMTFRHLTNNRIPNLFAVVAFLIALLTGYFYESKAITAPKFLYSYIGFALFSSGFATLLAFLFVKYARQDLIRYNNSNQ